jgi:hypothetical protein
VSCGGPEDDQFLRTSNGEPTKTIVRFWIRKRKKMARRLGEHCNVALQIISDDCRIFLVIGEGYNVRKLEIVLIPACYSKCVLTKLECIEVDSLLQL